jgi:tetratricopeptide (TPR) repeat protein
LQNRLQAALDAWQRAIAAARRAGLRRLEYRYRGNMGMTLVEGGRFEEALSIAREALAELNAVGDSYAAADALAIIGYAHHLQGNQAAALELIEQAIDLKRRLGDSVGAAMFDDIRVWILFLMGRIPEALTLAEGNKRELEASGSTWLVAFALDVLGMAQLLAGDLAQAQATLRQAFALPDLAGKWIHHFLFNDLALVTLAQGAVAQAQQTLEEAPLVIGIWQELDRLLVTGAVALGRGNTAQATALAATLAEQAAAAGYQLYVQRAARLTEAIHNPPALAELPRFIWVDKK